MAVHEVTLRAATEADIPIVRRLAHEVWWPTYGTYLPHDQVSLMLRLIYSEPALLAQFNEGQRFSLATRGGAAVGFVGFRFKPNQPLVMRIEKLYVAQSEQGKGTGKLLIDHIAQIASEAGCTRLELNVNRHNPAVQFYRRMGFVAIETVDIPYHGYVLNDYIMRKQLRP